MLDKTKPCVLIGFPPSIGVSPGNRGPLLFRRAFENHDAALYSLPSVPKGYRTMIEQDGNLFDIAR